MNFKTQLWSTAAAKYPTCFSIELFKMSILEPGTGWRSLTGETFPASSMSSSKEELRIRFVGTRKKSHTLGQESSFCPLIKFRSNCESFRCQIRNFMRAIIVIFYFLL